MDQQVMSNQFCSSGLPHWLQKFCSTSPVVVGLCLGVLLCWPITDASALPTADEIMTALHLSDGDKEQVRQGEIVDWSPKEGSDRELALGMVFLVKAPLEELAEAYKKALSLRDISVITAHGTITGEGKMEDLAGVALQPNGKNEAKRYLNVEPGDKLNLDAKEMEAFRALQSATKDGAVPVKKVEQLIREGLLARYKAYHTKGLAGIAPYDRGGGEQRNPGDELALSTKQMTLVAKHLPVYYNHAMNYPKGLPKEEVKNFSETFYWLNIDIFGRPTYVLVHRMLYQFGEGAMAIERQYYASHDYNSMLQGIAALQAKEGLFLFYIGRVSTDQVAGLTSAALHPVSRAIAAPYIKDMFRKTQAKHPKKK